MSPANGHAQKDPTPASGPLATMLAPGVQRIGGSAGSAVSSFADRMAGNEHHKRKAAGAWPNGSIRNGHRVPYAHNASTQTARNARREAMSFFGKSQTRKRTMRKMKETSRTMRVPTMKEDDGGYSVRVCRLCQW